MQETRFQAAGYYAEPPEVVASNLAVGVRLLSAALVSFFGAFLFAFVYLRERDVRAVWRPSIVKVPMGTGVAVVVLVVASTLFTAVAVAAMRSRGAGAWRPAAIVSELLALGALGVQCYQWAVLGFGPGSGPYASVFIAWTGFYAGVGLLSAIYWAQTTIAASIRHAGEKPGSVTSVASGGEGGGSGFNARLGVEVRAFAFYWYFLAAVQIVTFVLLYLVA